MKKISILLVVVMALAMMTCAFAQDISMNSVDPNAVHCQIKGTNVNLRTGAGTSYASLGLVSYPDLMNVYDNAYCNADGKWWYSGNMASGVHEGLSGWVRGDYLTLLN